MNNKEDIIDNTLTMPLLVRYSAADDIEKRALPRARSLAFDGLCVLGCLIASWDVPRRKVARRSGVIHMWKIHIVLK